jgi:hypothetical protein
MRSHILIMTSWEVMLCLFDGYCFRGTCYPWNIRIHLTTRFHMPKDWNYDFKMQWQSVYKCILAYRQTWNSSILGSTKLPETCWADLGNNKLLLLYLVGLPILWSSLVSPIICLSWRLFILLLRFLWNGIWNFLSYEIFTAKKI